MKSIHLDPRALADVEMLAIGGFAPLTGFMGKADYNSVIERMRMADGTVWPIPITFAVFRDISQSFNAGDRVNLLQAGQVVAVLHVTEKFPADRAREAQRVYGTTDIAHPGVRALQQQGDILLGGKLEIRKRPAHADLKPYRLTPVQTKKLFAKRGWKTIVGFQTRNPIHRAHEYLTKCALETVDGLFLHPLVGVTKADDIPAAVRMKCYEVLLENYYPKKRVIMGVNPANMYYAGPREAVLHALVRRNFGCTHFIVGRDHAGVGAYYGTYDAQKIFSQFKPEELGITPMFFDNSFYCKTCRGMASLKTCPHSASERVSLSGSQVRDLLSRKQAPPIEYARPEIVKVLLG